jgi:hypothetical protein
LLKGGMDGIHSKEIALPLSNIIACILIGRTSQLSDRGSHQLSW